MTKRPPSVSAGVIQNVNTRTWRIARKHVHEVYSEYHSRHCHPTSTTLKVAGARAKGAGQLMGPCGTEGLGLVDQNGNTYGAVLYHLPGAAGESKRVVLQFVKGSLLDFTAVRNAVQAQISTTLLREVGRGRQHSSTYS
eukprot:6474503-Amphidinium_carterae.1